jgi:hypothetical protein
LKELIKIKVMKTTLKKQLEAFEKGIYLDSYGNEDVIWTVTPKCGHSGEAEVWGRQNNFNGPIAVGQNMNKIYKQSF